MSEADRLWREAAEHIARVLDEHDGCPCKPNDAWSDEDCDMYVSGQLDAQSSWQLRIRNLPRPAGWGEGGKGHE